MKWNMKRDSRCSRLLTLALCGLMMGAGLPLLACSGTGEDATSAPATDTTASVTDTATETETVPVTESPTESATEPATESPDEIAKRKQERMDALYAATENRILPIGGWGTPASTLREVYSGTPGSYDRVWQLFADAHLNFMVSLEEWSSPLWTLDSASSAYKAGMKLWYNCSALDADGALERINSILNSEYAGVLDTVYLKDEPSCDDFNAVRQLYEGIRAGLGDRSMTYFANLLPTYAPDAVIANDYRGYVQNYIKTVKPDVLMFDFYPFVAGDNVRAMLANNAIAAQEANAAGIPVYTFIQSSGIEGGAEPTEAQLRLNVQLNLATGSKGLCYFTVGETYEGWGYTPAVTSKGETTELYNKIKTVNGEVLAMKGVYLDYTCRGMMTANYTGISREFQKNGCQDFLLDSFGELTGAQAAGSGKFVIGCFENAAGEKAYYVVNADYRKQGTVTLTFGETGRDYTLWGASGLTDMGSASGDVTLTLAPGEGVFLRLEAPAA